MRNLPKIALATRSPQSWRHFPILAATTLLFATACDFDGGPTQGGTISEETFIEVYVALRQAQQRATDPAAFVAERQRILEAHGVTEDQLIGYIERHGRDIDYVADLWAELERRLATADSAS